MLNNSIKLLLLTIALIGVIIYGVLDILASGGGFFSSIKVLLLMVPLALIIFSKLQPYWVAMAICSLGVDNSLPIPLVDRLSAWSLISLAIFAVTLMNLAIRKQPAHKLFSDPASKMVLILALAITARVAIDRPGSARMGGTGGLGEAFSYLLIGFAYWALARNTVQAFNLQRALRLIVLVSSALFCISFFRSISGFIRGSGGVLFTVPLWVASCSVLALMFNARAEKRRVWWAHPIWMYLVIFFVLVCSFVSAERAYPVMAMGLVLCIAACYRRARSVSLRSAMILVPLLSIILMFAPHKLPQTSFRAISLFAPTISKNLAQKYVTDVAMGEFGWENNFRATMAKHAWNSISQHPLVGKGFAFSFDDIFGAVMTVSGSGGGLEASLAVSGGYHNGFLSLAYFCGLPVACLGLLALVLIAIKFFARLRRMPPGPDKTFGVAVLAMEVPFILHLLSQGSGPVWLQMFILSGIATGLMYKFSQKENLTQSEVNQSVTPHPEGTLAPRKMLLGSRL